MRLRQVAQEVDERRPVGRTISSLVRFNFIALDPEETIARAKLRIQRAPPQPVYPVVSEGAVLGILTAAYLESIAPEYWQGVKVHWLVRRSRMVPALDLGTDALQALAQIDAFGLEGLPVCDSDGGVIALIERRAIRGGAARSNSREERSR